MNIRNINLNNINEFWQQPALVLSSAPSGQSRSPSHTQCCGIHLVEPGHWNSFSVHVLFSARKYQININTDQTLRCNEFWESFRNFTFLYFSVQLFYLKYIWHLQYIIINNCINIHFWKRKKKSQHSDLNKTSSAEKIRLFICFCTLCAQ